MSNNLELSQVAAAQNSKEVTINDQAGQLDAGLTDKVDVVLTGTTSPLVLSDAQALRCMVFKLTGTHPGGAYEVHCPTNKKIYVVWNGTAGEVTFKTVAGAGIPVNAGAVLILYCDGSGPPRWCGGGTPIRSASCAHGARCLRSWGVRHPPRPPRPAPAWSPS
jgi:hypothetical protein